MKINSRLLFFTLALYSAASAAGLTGTVKDPQQRPVSGAIITLISTTGAAGSETTSDTAGAYWLRAEAPLFALFVAADIHLTEAAATRDVALELAGVREQVVVTASGTPQTTEQVSKAITAIDQADADSSRCEFTGGRCGPGAQRARATTRRTRSLHIHPTPRATSASYFYTWLQDMINFDTSGLIDPATDPFGRFIGYRNTRDGISRGFELSEAAAVTRKLGVTASYTYINALERTPIVGDVLRTFVVPRNQFSVLVTEQATSRLSLTLDTRASSSYLGPIYGDTVAQAYRFDGMHKVNPGASYRIPMKEYQAIRFFVRADNIFNQTYFENGFLTPGRTAMGGVQFEF